MSPWDPSSELFTLDDATEGMERENLNEGFTATLEAMIQAKGTLQDIIVPTDRVFTWSCLSISFFFIYFCFLTTVFFQSLIARSQEKSWFLHEHKEDWDRLIDEAWLHRDVTAQLRQSAQRDMEDAEKSFDELRESARRD